MRKVAQELGVDIDGLAGTGPQGRITEEDVRAAAGSGGQAPEGRSEPLRGVRRVIAEHMARAHREVPPVTWVEECDFEAVDMEKLVATVVKACADELQAFPELNARLDGDAIVYLDRYDIGVAVQTAQGLVVPVVRGCDAKTSDEIHAELARSPSGRAPARWHRRSSAARRSRSRAPGSSAASSRRRSSTTPRWRSSPSAESRPGRWSATARSPSAARARSQ